MSEQKEPKKRTSKKSKIAENTITTLNNEETLIVITEKLPQEVVCKKRGRKPKGGKIISDSSVQENIIPIRPNVILHLKCSVKDLNTTGEYNSNFTSSNIDPYNTDTIKSEYGQYNTDDLCIINNKPQQNEVITTTITTIDESIDNSLIETKDIWKKLKTLEHNLHVNNISDKKSACFWCSYDFDNPSIYIPKYQSKDTYHVYGCFCSPECAVAYLMNENIDNSIRFERYALLNHMYSKIYEYNKNIKPAPNPHYILEKYYGNLTIQEYRALLKSHRLYLMIEKPLTRILPEYYDDNDDFIINNKVIPSSIQSQMKKTLRTTSSNQLFYDGL